MTVNWQFLANRGRAVHHDAMRVLALLPLLAVVTLGTAAAQDAAPPLCDRAAVVLDDTIDSSRARAGNTFRFQLAADASAPDGTPLRRGLFGYGIVAVAHVAERSGIPGYLVIEARYLELPDGRHVPVAIDDAHAGLQLIRGATANAPVVTTIVPYMAIAAGAYNFIHFGKDATIWRASVLPVLIGDDAIIGRCR